MYIHTVCCLSVSISQFIHTYISAQPLSWASLPILRYGHFIHQYKYIPGSQFSLAYSYVDEVQPGHTLRVCVYLSLCDFLQSIRLYSIDRFHNLYRCIDRGRKASIRRKAGGRMRLDWNLEGWRWIMATSTYHLYIIGLLTSIHICAYLPTYLFNDTFHDKCCQTPHCVYGRVG